MLHHPRRHRFQHGQRAADVVAIVASRLAHRFADVEEGGEMHDGEDLVPFERAADRVDVRDVAFDEVAVLHRVTVPRDEIVVDDDAVAGAVERLRRMAADVPGAAGDQHRARFSGQWKNR